MLIDFGKVFFLIFLLALSATIMIDSKYPGDKWINHKFNLESMFGQFFFVR